MRDEGRRKGGNLCSLKGSQRSLAFLRVCVPCVSVRILSRGTGVLFIMSEHQRQPVQLQQQCHPETFGCVGR